MGWVGGKREALRKIEIKPFIQLIIESVLKLCSVVLDVVQ